MKLTAAGTKPSESSDISKTESSIKGSSISGIGTRYGKIGHEERMLQQGVADGLVFSVSSMNDKIRLAIDVAIVNCCDGKSVTL